MITLYDLEFFDALVRYPSQNSAASGLGITRAAVSQRISVLEERIGVRLIERTRGHLALTPQGRTVLASSRRILDELSMLKQLLNDTRSLDDDSPVALAWFDETKQTMAFRRANQFIED